MQYVQNIEGRGDDATAASWLLLEPEALSDRPRMEMRGNRLDRLFSLLEMLARSDLTGVSDNVLGSMWDCGNMPHCPFELVPDQHQCSE